ncbi:hypothetical protein WMY93_009947 [Mugilogobius chulae]|uniref:Integrase catalytic domain-containing protein n=1 Tax=Mugilogobius chulae TaxID=88201 RepID=A0AAW0PIB6_9GOBI
MILINRLKNWVGIKTRHYNGLFLSLNRTFAVTIAGAQAKEEHQIWNRWAPPAEQRDFDRRLRELELHLPKLVSGKVALIKAASIKEDTERQPVTAHSTAAAIKLKATALPKFTGIQRDYYRWRREWEALQKQGEPTGSREVRKFQLLDSLDEKVAKDLRLSTYTTADEIFRVLKNRYVPRIHIRAIGATEGYRPAKEKTKFATKYARTKTTKSTSEAGCIICGDTRHKKKLYICRKFRTAKLLSEKRDAVQQLGACKRCLEVHNGGPCRNSTYLCGNPECKDQHHYLLCPLPRNQSQRSSKSGPVRAEGRRYTEDQEAFLSKLPPELAQQCRDAFCNVISRAYNSASDEKGLLEGNGLHEYPVILMLLDVTANDGQRVGALIDLASDTNYITHRAASKLNLQSENVTLVVHGVGGMKASVATKRYLLKIRVSTPRGTLKSHQLICYGLDTIAEVHRHVPAHKLQKIFPDVALKDLVRPKEIHLLISHKEGQLVPQKVRSIGDLVLWDGPLGKTVGGTHPDLFEEVTVTAHTSKTHFARSMRTAAEKYKELTHRDPVPCPEIQSSAATSSKEFLKWWKWESIGAAFEPRCGEEREMEIIRNGLTYVTGDDHSPEPHWHAKYPWTEEPESLPNNKRAVEATFLRTEKQLSKEPEWKTAYTSQVHEMVDRKAAVKLSKDVLQSWAGPVWYVSHLIAPNPHSVSTPVRLVWNSSQRYRGLSLNDMLIKGPDVLNPIRAVLLRFRAGVFAALGDIRKMYNSVWLEEREVHLHRFLWRDTEDSEIEDFAITRVNIGDKPAGCIAQVAMRETANLPPFSHLKEERRVLEEDAYVDDILTSHNDLDHLNLLTSNIERILRAGGFYMKPWVYSAQINFSKKKKKMRLGQDLLKEEVRSQTPDPLTRRQLLSQVSGLYDPLGLVTPAKQKGAILVRRAFQEAKVKYCLEEDTWDAALSKELREDAIKLLEEYAVLSQLRFTRSLTPLDPCAQPIGITFSDGSEHAYGAVMYLRWSCSDGVVVRLVESKAKLTLLTTKRHCRIDVEKWFHLVDSQTVLGAIQRESYGYQTFFANRIGEIQSSTSVDDWWWIPGPVNIADVITRGASPELLTEDSEWQSGPKFLLLPVDESPKKSARDVAAQARDNVAKIQKKTFTAVLTRTHLKGQDPVQEPKRRPPAGAAVRELVEEGRFSDLRKLVKTIALIWRAAKKFRRVKTKDKEKWEAVESLGVVTVFERRDAFRDLCLAAQEGVNFPSTTTDRLVVYRDQSSGLLVCGGRVQTFTEDQKAVPLLPFQAWISTLLAREAHAEGHEGVAGTLLRMRRKAWVVKGRILAQKVVDKCIICKKAKARTCRQIMGDLPEERSSPAAPFQFTSVDLFGPYHVKDDVKKRVTMKVWGVVFCCMSSRAIHVELASTLSTESFLLAYQRFAAVRGHPQKIWSDPGTNFIGAKPILKDMYSFLRGQDKASLEEYATRNGTQWTWKIHPADSPHRNGAAEAAVRVTKRALLSLRKVEGLTFNEFLTALQLAANLANERPIDARIQSKEDRIESISPNTLLLGRASPGGDFKSFDYTTYPLKRLKEYKTKSTTSGSPGANSPVRIYSFANALRGQFKIARVVGVNPDHRGVVRDVHVKVSPSYGALGWMRSPKSGPVVKDSGSPLESSKSCQSTILHRDVRRLVVLVPVEDQVQ